MSDADSGLDLSSPEAVARVVRELTARVDELEGDLARERAHREQLQQKLDAIRYEGEGDLQDADDVRKLFVGDIPIGLSIDSKAKSSVVEALEKDVDRLLDGTHAADPEDQPTTIQTYASIPPAGRDSLGDSDRRATYIFENFSEWADTTPAGKGVLSTRRDRNGKSRLKPLLQEATDEELEWPQVYRAMARVAKLSGGDEHCVDDGAFVYKDGWNDPFSDKKTTVKALVLERPEVLRESPDGEGDGR